VKALISTLRAYHMLLTVVGPVICILFFVVLPLNNNFRSCCVARHIAIWCLILCYETIIWNSFVRTEAESSHVLFERPACIQLKKQQLSAFRFLTALVCYAPIDKEVSVSRGLSFLLFVIMNSWRFLETPAYLVCKLRKSNCCNAHANTL
jgi:hypothetical protein